VRETAQKGPSVACRGCLRALEIYSTLPVASNNGSSGTAKRRTPSSVVEYLHSCERRAADLITGRASETT